MQNFVQKISENIKNLLSGENKEKARLLWVKGRKYFYAVLLFIVFSITITQFTGKNAKGLDGTQGTEQGSEVNSIDEDFELADSFEKDENAALNELIANYFAAYAANEQDTLSKLAYPMTNNEKSYIGIFSQYIEKYENVKCYYKEGPTKGSYLVSVAYDLKFIGVDTLAPGMDFFYVETDKDGALYINNLYSAYNMGRTENDLDANVYSVILKYEQQKDVIALLEETEQKYTDAIASDVNLATMMSTTIPSAMAQWLESISNLENGTENTTEQTTENTQGQTTENTESQNSESSESQNSEATESQNSESQTAENSESETSENQEPENQTPEVQQVKALVKVFVRTGPGTDYPEHGKAETGEVLKKLGEEGDWVKVEYKGAEGYIRKDLVEDVTE